MSELMVKNQIQTTSSIKKRKKVWKQAQLDLETPVERAARRTREVLGVHARSKASFPSALSESKEQIRVKSVKLKGTL